MDKKYGSRKFVVAVLLTVATTGLAVGQLFVCKDINFAAIAVIFGLVGAGYGLTNVLSMKEANK